MRQGLIFLNGSEMFGFPNNCVNESGIAGFFMVFCICTYCSKCVLISHLTSVFKSLLALSTLNCANKLTLSNEIHTKIEVLTEV